MDEALLGQLQATNISTQAAAATLTARVGADEVLLGQLQAANSSVVAAVTPLQTRVSAMEQLSGSTPLVTAVLADSSALQMAGSSALVLAVSNATQALLSTCVATPILQGGNMAGSSTSAGASGLSYPYMATANSCGGMYVADTSNHRVLYYPTGSFAATRVYG